MRGGEKKEHGMKGECTQFGGGEEKRGRRTRPFGFSKQTMKPEAVYHSVYHHL